MAIQINFDVTHNPETPTILLAKKNGDIIGMLDAKSIDMAEHLKDASEISFSIYKYVDNKLTPLWEQITNFKLVYCIEWNMWFEIKVELDESTETIKTVFCTQLGNAELSQIMLYNTQINTEEDIARDDYIIPTVFYNTEHPEASLLHRILEKAPHYKVTYVDSSICNIQRTFTFDGVSIYDAFQQIADEINCLFVFPSCSDENGKIQRTIEVYDLESFCLDCNYRGDFNSFCPECGSSNISEGYGEDTTIFVTSDELADKLQLSSNKESVKNCFKLEAGDDLMTATIINCNPNGTSYLWRISDEMKSEMSSELSEKIDEYDKQYNYYNNDYEANIDANVLTNYNTLVDKYKVFNDELEKISIPIVGFSSLMNADYNTIDFVLYLQSALMPNINVADTDAKQEVEKLTVENLSPVAISDISNISLSSVNNAVLSIAKIIIDSRYKVKIQTSSIDENSKIWTGNFTVTNYSDEEDYAESNVISILINDDYQVFVEQKIEKALQKGNTEDMSIVDLFKKDYDNFVIELTKYSLNGLNAIYDSCQGCIDILIEQGISDKKTWSGNSPNLYDDLYVPYLNKLSAIESELKVRNEEINSIIGVYNAEGELISYGLQNYIEDIKNTIQDLLNFEEFLGNTLWLEFCSFRREDKYVNSNYISDGLNNAELINNANDFIQVAQKEINKSSELQYTISSTLKNLLTIKKFQPLVNHFKVGNWLRVQIDDEIYKLRLLKYCIQYDDIDNLEVEFSDAINVKNSITTVQKSLMQAQTMASSYESIKRQAKLGANSDRTITNIIENGISMSTVSMMNSSENQNQSWNERGMLFREYDPIEEDYDGEQIKIINSTIAMTNDKWTTTKTAFGKFFYYDPVTKTMKQGYGLNGELLVGKLFIGEGLGIYNEAGTLTFDSNGFNVTNGINTVSINPNNKLLFNIRNNTDDLFTFDDNGDIVIVGNITAKSLKLSDGVIINSDKIDGLSSVALTGQYEDLHNIPEFHRIAYSGLYSDLLEIPEFANVAYSGEYDDILNKPILSNVATTGQYEDLEGLPDLSVIETNTQNIETNTNDIIILKEEVATLKEAINSMI